MHCQALTDRQRFIVLPFSSSGNGGTSAGGGSGGLLKITVNIQAPRVMGCERTGLEVIVITAALVITPPSRRLARVSRLRPSVSEANRRRVFLSCTNRTTGRFGN